MKKRVTKSVAKGMKAALDVVLQTEANTASCIIMYQPKAPKELMNYRRNINGKIRATPSFTLPNPKPIPPARISGDTNSLLLLVSPLILAGGIGFGLGSVKLGVALIFPFMFLRKFSGGYHAKKLHTCIMGSGFLLFLCIMVSMHMQCDWKLAIATGIASVSLIAFSPIDSENRRLDTDEKRTYKKITVFCVIFFGLLDIVLFLLGKYIYTICFSVGILLTAGLQAPYIVKKMRKSTKNGL